MLAGPLRTGKGRGNTLRGMDISFHSSRHTSVSLLKDAGIPAISARDWAALREADADPLANRAISAYAPGSAYKIVTALAGLSVGLQKARFICAGGVSYGNTCIKCWIAEKARRQQR